MNYKLLKIALQNGIEEYPIPTGWEINQVLFATDFNVVLILREIQNPVLTHPTNLDVPAYRTGTATLAQPRF